MKLGKVMHHNIVIESSNNMGFVAHVGCGRFVFESKENLLAALDQYLTCPIDWENTYIKSHQEEATEASPEPPQTYVPSGSERDITIDTNRTPGTGQVALPVTEGRTSR